MNETASQLTIEEQIKQAIETSVPNSTAEVGGDGRHFEIQVVSPVFEGKRTLEKQRLVYACLLYTSPSPRDRQKSRMPSSA